MYLTLLININQKKILNLSVTQYMHIIKWMKKGSSKILISHYTEAIVPTTLK